MVKTRKLRKMGRRRFLDSLSTLGVSAATLNYITKDALAEVTNNPEEEVPRLLGLVHTNHEEIVSNNAVPEREPRFYTIPRSEWARTEATHQAAHQLARVFKSEPQVDVAVSTRGGEFDISVKYLRREHVDGSISFPDVSLEKVKEAMPTQITGEVEANGKTYIREDIDVTVRECRTKEQAEFDSKFRPVPGGCQAADDSNWTIGTPATALQDGSQCWVTAAHCFKRTAGKDILQPEDSVWSSNKIGESRQYTREDEGDLGTIVSTGPDNSYNIAENDGTYGWQISGVLSRDKLKDMQSNYEELYQQGRTTGRNSGTILEVDTYNIENVILNVDTDGGDSGGPYFHVTDGVALIGAIHSASMDYDDDGNFDEAIGNLMAWGEEVLDVRV